MTERILFKARAGENGIDVRTYAPRMASPHSFYIFYEELYRLESAGRILASDIHSFAKIRIDGKHDRATFEITWLSGHSGGRVEGYEQYVYLRWSRFREFLGACRQPDGPKDFKAVSLGPRRDRPRLAFVGGRKNLKAAIADRRVRHKLGKALSASFQWPDADEIRIADDFVPYSFFFQEIRDDRPVMCGGLILHGQEDMSKAYYGLHT